MTVAFWDPFLSGLMLGASGAWVVSCFFYAREFEQAPHVSTPDAQALGEVMARRKVEHPEAREKLAAAQELIRRGLEGGLVSDQEGDDHGWRKSWERAQGKRSREVARRFRGLLAAEEGVRVLCDARKWALRGIWLELDVPGGRLFCPARCGEIRHAEG